MMTSRIAGLTAIGLALTCGSDAAGGQQAGQDEGRPEQPQVITPLDEIRRVGHLIGVEVGSVGGEDGIARIRDLAWDGRGRAIAFLLSPGTGDAGPEFIPVPARSLSLTRLEDEEWAVQVDTERDRLGAVPKLGAAEVDALLDPGRIAAIEAHFAPREDPPAVEPVEPTDPSILVRATELLGRPVLGGDGPVAQVEEILTGGQHQASYLVLAPEGDPGRLVPVPFSALSIRREDGGAVVPRIGMDRAQLAHAPALEGDWTKMLNGSFAQAVHNVHAKRED